VTRKVVGVSGEVVPANVIKRLTEELDFRLNHKINNKKYR
jgi:hypothetical protein